MLLDDMNNITNKNNKKIFGQRNLTHFSLVSDMVFRNDFFGCTALFAFGVRVQSSFLSEFFFPWT